MSIRDDDGSTTGSTPTTGIDPYATLNRRRRGVRVTYAAAVVVGLAVGGGAIAGAATGSTTSTTQPADQAEGGGEHAGLGTTPPAAFGTVATVGATTFTLTSHDGTPVTVNVSGTTTYVDPAVTTPTFTDVKVGDHVAVLGTIAGTTVAATKVAVGGMGGHGDFDGHGDAPGGLGGTPPAAEGTVASVSSNAFTLTTHDGTKVTVAVGTATTYKEFGKTSPSITDVTVGAHVDVFGTDVNNSVTATQVRIAGTGGPGGPGGTEGSGGPGGPDGPGVPGGPGGSDGSGGADGTGSPTGSSSSATVPSASSNSSTASSSGSNLA